MEGDEEDGDDESSSEEDVKDGDDESSSEEDVEDHGDAAVRGWRFEEMGCKICCKEGSWCSEIHGGDEG